MRSPRHSPNATTTHEYTTHNTQHNTVLLLAASRWRIFCVYVGNTRPKPPQRERETKHITARNSTPTTNDTLLNYTIVFFICSVLCKQNEQQRHTPTPTHAVLCCVACGVLSSCGSQPAASVFQLLIYTPRLQRPPTTPSSRKPAPHRRRVFPLKEVPMSHRLATVCLAPSSRLVGTSCFFKIFFGGLEAAGTERTSSTSSSATSQSISHRMHRFVVIIIAFSSTRRIGGLCGPTLNIEEFPRSNAKHSLGGTTTTTTTMGWIGGRRLVTRRVARRRKISATTTTLFIIVLLLYARAFVRDSERVRCAPKQVRAAHRRQKPPKKHIHARSSHARINDATALSTASGPH